MPCLASLDVRITSPCQVVRCRAQAQACPSHVPDARQVSREHACAAAMAAQQRRSASAAAGATRATTARALEAAAPPPPPSFGAAAGARSAAACAAAAAACAAAAAACCSCDRRASSPCVAHDLRMRWCETVTASGLPGMQEQAYLLRIPCSHASKQR